MFYALSRESGFSCVAFWQGVCVKIEWWPPTTALSENQLFCSIPMTDSFIVDLQPAHYWKYTGIFWTPISITI